MSQLFQTLTTISAKCQQAVGTCAQTAGTPPQSTIATGQDSTSPGQDMEVDACAERRRLQQMLLANATSSQAPGGPTVAPAARGE
eukprot:8512650-Karenia_brevis.AAC.1